MQRRSCLLPGRPSSWPAIRRRRPSSCSAARPALSSSLPSSLALPSSAFRRRKPSGSLPSRERAWRPRLSSVCARSCVLPLLQLSVHLGPGLLLANQATERAALQLQRVAAREHEIAGIGLAVLGIVHLSGPFVFAGRLHAEHDLHADQRTAALGGVGVILVGLRLLGVGIGRLLQPDDRPAQSAAAIGDADARRAGLRQPYAARIGRERALRWREHQECGGREKVSSHVMAPCVLPPAGVVAQYLGRREGRQGLCASHIRNRPGPAGFAAWLSQAKPRRLAAFY